MGEARLPPKVDLCLQAARFCRRRRLAGCEPFSPGGSRLMKLGLKSLALAVTVALLCVPAAFAKGGNGNGNGQEHGKPSWAGGNGGGHGHGKPEWAGQGKSQG